MTHPINSYQNCDDESHVHPYETNVEAKHAELIELVSKGTMEQDNRDFSIKVAVDSAKALLDVLELHKPTAIFWTDDIKENYCGTCGDTAWVPYPCQTIQIIENGLL